MRGDFEVGVFRVLSWENSSSLSTTSGIGALVWNNTKFEFPKRGSGTPGVRGMVWSCAAESVLGKVCQGRRPPERPRANAPLPAVIGEGRERVKRRKRVSGDRPADRERPPLSSHHVCLCPRAAGNFFH